MLLKLLEDKNGEVQNLAVRCLGDLTKPRLDTLRLADKIARDELRAAGLEAEIREL